MAFEKLTSEEKKKRSNERKRVQYEKEHKLINGIDHKFCNLHYKYFPEEEPWVIANSEFFYINTSNSIDGLNTRCKRCEVKRAAKWIKDHPKQFKAAVKKYMSTDEFKIWEKEKEERIYPTRVRWRQNNSDKQKGYSKKRKPKKHIIYDEEWQACKNFFNQRCAYCGLPIEDHIIRYGGQHSYVHQDLQKDHTIFDGKNDLSNCIPGCKSCNISKGEKSLNDWYNPSNPNYTYERYHQIYLWLRYEYKKHILPKRRYKHQPLSARLKEVELQKKSRKKTNK